MGGLAGGSARNEILIFCMSAASTGWGCNSGNIGTWIKLTAASGSACNTFGHYCGNTGKRDGGRLAFDSLNNRILLFGGVKSGYFWNSVAQFDAHTGDVCLSMVVMQLKAPPIAPMPWSGCPLPPLGGTPPPLASGTSPNRTLKFPSWLYDSNPVVSKAAFYGGDDTYPGGGIWLYDSTTNIWTQPAVTGGPVIDSKQTSEQSWAYDSVDDVIVWESGGSKVALWQLPGASLLP